MIRKLIDEVELGPGETVLNVGCGTGPIGRWIARHTDGANQIVGVDISRYMLEEAEALAQREGLKIDFREENAESLSFPDNSFDVSLACTVLEEGNAEKMLNEFVRVTKPGGRVAAVVRGEDMPWWVNLPLRAELKAKVDAPRGTSGEPACDDASLYRRFHEAGLTNVKMLPQLAAYTCRSLIGEYYLERAFQSLSPEEMNEWRESVVQAEADGTYFIAQPFHCAVGTKPL
jgi:ubiquinone/menaquinone biosynthesis C-methylase UbiE